MHGKKHIGRNSEEAQGGEDIVGRKPLHFSTNGWEEVQGG